MSDWFKSSYSGTANCVEMKRGDERVMIRSSISLDTVTFTHGEWLAFVAGVKAGEFDLEETTE